MKSEAEEERSLACTPKNFDDLPLEIIIHILNFLPYPDLKDARLVCRRFHIASLENCFLDREKVVFDKKFLRCDLADLLKCNRDFWHLQLEVFRPFSYVEEIWCHIGSKLKSLSLSYCQLKEDDFFGILSHCTKLKHLIIDTCFVKISSATENFYWSRKPTPDLRSPKLLYLESFSVTFWFDPGLFLRLLMNTPRLKSLSVAGFQREHVGYACMPLTTGDIFYYIEECKHKFEELKLMVRFTHEDGLITENYVEREVADELSKMPIQQLRKFSTNVCPGGEFVKKQLQMCKELSLFEVSVHIYQTEKRRVLQHYPQDEDEETETYIPLNLSFVKNLTSLTLSGCSVTADRDSDYLLILCGEINTTLKTLEISGTDNLVNAAYEDIPTPLTPKSVSEIARTHPVLTHLNLANCPAINDYSVQSIFCYQVLLESLTLSGCENLTDAGLRGQLDIETAETDVFSYPKGYHIGRLKKLHLLDLSSCTRVTGTAFADSVQFPDLRRLNLNETKVSHDYLARFFENNRTIEVLGLTDGAKFTDSFIDCIVKNLWRLSEIEIASSELEISARGIELLKKHCRRVVLEKVSFWDDLNPYRKEEEMDEEVMNDGIRSEEQR